MRLKRKNLDFVGTIGQRWERLKQVTCDRVHANLLRILNIFFQHPVRLKSDGIFRMSFVRHQSQPPELEVGEVAL